MPAYDLALPSVGTLPGTVDARRSRRGFRPLRRAPRDRQRPPSASQPPRHLHASATRRGPGGDTCVAAMSGGASQEISLNEPGKSQVPRISNLTCGFFVTARSKSGHRHLRRCCGYEVARATGRAAEPRRMPQESQREPTESDSGATCDLARLAAGRFAHPAEGHRPDQDRGPAEAEEAPGLAGCCRVSVAGVGRRRCCHRGCQLSHLLAIAGRFGGRRRGSPARRCRPAFPRSRTPATGR